MESENKIRTIKAAVQPEVESLHHRTFTSMPMGRPSIKTYGLGIGFQSDENNSMVAETLEEYVLAYTKAAY